MTFDLKLVTVLVSIAGTAFVDNYRIGQLEAQHEKDTARMEQSLEKENEAHRQWEGIVQDLRVDLASIKAALDEIKRRLPER